MRTANDASILGAIARAAAIACLSLFAFAVGAQTVTVTATPSAGTSPLAVSVAWSTTGFPSGTVTCTASGAWSGTKAPSGTETVTVLSGTHTFTLACSGVTEPASLQWTPPTTNVDGTPLTDLSHYNLYSAATATGVTSGSTATRINAPASAFSVTGLPVGPRCFGLTAVNTAGLASQLSSIACTDIAQPTATGSAGVTATSAPNPPTAVTVGVVLGMNMAPVYNVTTAGALGTSLKGFVDLDVACGSAVVGSLRGFEFREVPVSAVKWWGSTAKRVAAPCATSTTG